MSPRAAARRGSGHAVIVTVVHSPGCHFCDDAERAIATLSACYPLEVDRVDIRSERGLALVAAHRAPMSPLVLLDGVFFSFGRLPRRKLAAELDGRFGHPATALMGAVRSVRWDG
jgi:hypothetical protein